MNTHKSTMAGNRFRLKNNNKICGTILGEVGSYNSKLTDEEEREEEKKVTEQIQAQKKLDEEADKKNERIEQIKDAIKNLDNKWIPTITYVREKEKLVSELNKIGDYIHYGSCAYSWPFTRRYFNTLPIYEVRLDNFAITKFLYDEIELIKES